MSSSTSFGMGQQAPSAAAAPIIDASTPWVAAADGNLPLLQQALPQLSLTVATAVDERGYTLLQAAASYSQLAVLRWLVRELQHLQQQQQTVPAGGASATIINAVDEDGDSALHYASTAAAAQFLVQEAGVDASLCNGAGLTALEAKRRELEELLQEEDTEDDDVDVVDLKGIVAYLESLSRRQQ